MRLLRWILAASLLLPLAAFGQSADLIVEKKTFKLPSYTTVAGATIKNVKIGWEAAGTLNADKSNAILVTHFFTGTSHAFGKYAQGRQGGRLLGLADRAGQGRRHQQILRAVVRHTGQPQRQRAQRRHHRAGEHQSRYRQALRDELPGGQHQGFRATCRRR